jgi:hypothetical protein
MEVRAGARCSSSLLHMSGRDPSLPDVMFDLAGIAAIALLLESLSRHSFPSMASKLISRKSRDTGKDTAWTRRHFY